MAALELKISPEIARIKDFQDKFLRRDFVNIESYYTGLEKELDGKEKRHAGDEEAINRIRDKKRTFALDRQKKISDLQEKYRLDMKAELVNLLILYQPWFRTVWGIRTREGEMERVFYWDPVLKEFSNVLCENCLNRCDAFFVQKKRLVCPTCEKKTLS